MNKYETQKKLEQMFDKSRVLEKYKNQWIPVLKQYPWSLCVPENYEGTLNMCLSILNTLAQRPAGYMFHNLVEILLARSRELDNIETNTFAITFVLNQGAIHGMWSFDQVTWSSGSNIKVRPLFGFSPECQEELNRCMYKLPMIIRPKKVKGNNRRSGYVTYQDSLLLNGRHHKGFINHKFLNRMNQVSLVLNTHLMDYFEPTFDTKNVSDPAEVQRIKDNNALFKQQLNLVAEFLGKEKFWLTHKYDYRGRFYCQGFHVNYQATGFNKASVEFANKEVITDDVVFPFGS